MISAAVWARDQATGWMKEQVAYVFGMYAFAYGFPLVMMDVTRRVMTAAPSSGEYSAPLGQFHRIRDFVDPDFKNVVRISRNSLWSTAWLDLDAEPVIFSNPATGGRYLVAQVMDMWTDNFASIGTRTTGEEPGHCLIAGPRWHGTPPPGIEATYRCDTRYAWVLVQIAAADAQDLPEVHALQDQLAITPLSAWGTGYAPSAEVPVDPAVDTTATPFDQVRLMDGPTFFQHLADAMKDNPPRSADRPMLMRLATIGLNPWQDFDAGRVDPATAKGLSRAARRVWGLLETAPYQIKGVKWEELRPYLRDELPPDDTTTTKRLGRPPVGIPPQSPVPLLDSLLAPFRAVDAGYPEREAVALSSGAGTAGRKKMISQIPPKTTAAPIRRVG